MLSSSKLADFLHLLIGAFLPAGFIIIVVQILEVEPPSQACLLAGMRVCAYWSTKYHYLHPGTIVKNTQVPTGQDTLVLQGNEVLSQKYSGTRGQDTQVRQGKKVLSQGTTG